MNDLSLLTSDPEAFFELAEGYDRRDLKRAYGKAIRIYKPETHAAEFGRVRDAYERLEKMLRYGKQQQQLANAVDAWTDSTGTPAEASTVGTSRSAGGRTTAHAGVQPNRSKQSAELSLRQLAVIDPAAALRQLQTQSRRTPPDYFLAAVLTDVAAGRPTAKYLAHLIEGLAAYPLDPGLMNLTSEYLRTEVPDAMIEKVVRYIAEKLRSAAFFMLTESLWLRLIELLPFEEFAGLLTACERDIRQTDPSTRTTFYLRLLRSAIWTAPPAWSERVMGQIESESAGLNLNAEAELEFLSQIQQLLKAEATSPSTDPVRQKLLGVIRLSCRRDDAASTAIVLKALHEIARDSSSLQQAFPMLTADDDGAWVMLTYAMVEQLQVYLDEPSETPTERLIIQTQRLVSDLAVHAQQVYVTFNRAESRYKFWPLVWWMVLGTLFGSFPLIMIVMMASGGSFAGAMLTLVAIGAVAVALYVSFHRWLFPKYLQPRMLKKQQQWTRAAYVKWWRSRMFRYAGSMSQSIQMLLAHVGLVTRMRNAADMGNVVAHFANQDAGLCIYAVLQTLLR